MTAVPPPTDLAAWLTGLEAARDAIGDSPAFRVVGFEQDAEDVLACFDDGGRSVFAECYGTDAAALIVAAVNALPRLVAAVRAALELHHEDPGASGWCKHCGDLGEGASDGLWPCPTYRALTAALTPERTTP